SLMSTPILNPPQSGILGMHAIKNRAVEDPKNPGQVVIRPMMYLALSYDHRIIAGAEAVRFLVKVKESIEDPRRLLLDLWPPPARSAASRGCAAPAARGTLRSAPRRQPMADRVAPVAESERIASVDVLRGVAVLGIFAMNIVAFAQPFIA